MPRKTRRPERTIASALPPEQLAALLKLKESL